jgi:hypothetical protein
VKFIVNEVELEQAFLVVSFTYSSDQSLRHYATSRSGAGSRPGKVNGFQWESQRLTTVWASTACYRDNLRGQVIGGRRRLHNEDVHNFYASSNIIRMMESGGMV